jgi:hypothetical protein
MTHGTIHIDQCVLVGHVMINHILSLYQAYEYHHHGHKYNHVAILHHFRTFFTTFGEKGEISNIENRLLCETLGNDESERRIFDGQKNVKSRVENLTPVGCIVIINTVFVDLA